MILFSRVRHYGRSRKRLVLSSFEKTAIELELEIRAANFQFGVTGFDTKRDLVVRAIEIKSDDETNV